MTIIVIIIVLESNSGSSRNISDNIAEFFRFTQFSKKKKGRKTLMVQLTHNPSNY